MPPNVSALTARIARTFDCDVHVLGTTHVPRPSGGETVAYGPIARTVRGRARLALADESPELFAGVQADQSRYLVTVAPGSDIPRDARVTVIHDSRAWQLTLHVVGVAGPRSTYVTDRLACVPVARI